MSGSEGNADDEDVFMECYYCSGERGCPRASAGSVRCSADRCKKKQAADNKAAKAGLADTLPLAGELMESASLPRYCFKIKEVVGVSTCSNRLTSKERRVGRARADEDWSYQVRGKFGDDSDEDSDDMVPDTRWVPLSELVEKLDEPACKKLDAFASSLQKVAKEARKRLRK